MARARSPLRRSPEIHGGQPVFAGTTIPVRELLDHLLRNGDLASFTGRWPELEPEQVLAVCALALEQLIERERVPSAPPQGSLLPRYDEAGAVVNAAGLQAGQVAGRKVLCPACRSLVFKAWPEGWDSHAEHRCSGIVAIDPEARKREFKRRYAHLFRSTPPRGPRPPGRKTSAGP